ncbi:MAG: hypothetical protein JKY09_03535 [Crocinitomicaceae bacterium]|nr:hypothetical protein [Crocinitomicaceae bacterium]
MREKKSGKGKYILIGLGVVTIAGIAYYFASRPKDSSDEIPEDTPGFPTPRTTSLVPSKASSSGTSSTSFPLKKWSQGILVKNLQNVLIKKYGEAVLPRFGADGQWGTELQNALVSKGLPTVIGQAEYTKLISTNGESGASSSSNSNNFNASKIADHLHTAIEVHDFDKVRRVFGYIHTVKGYKSVNYYFKNKRINGVRKTLVNALLSEFTSNWGKKILNGHFHRIGLKFDGTKWSLSGLNQVLYDQIKAVRQTIVWNLQGQIIKIPKDTILGEFIGAKDGVTKFRTLDDKILFTNTKSIRYV